MTRLGSIQCLSCGKRLKSLFDPHVCRAAKEGKRTLEGVRVNLRSYGIVISKKDGEYRVNFKGGTEGTAYYTNDLQDAENTGIAMYEERKGQQNLASAGASSVFERSDESVPGLYSDAMLDKATKAVTAFSSFDDLMTSVRRDKYVPTLRFDANAGDRKSSLFLRRALNDRGFAVYPEYGMGPGESEASPEHRAMVGVRRREAARPVSKFSNRDLPPVSGHQRGEKQRAGYCVSLTASEYAGLTFASHRYEPAGVLMNALQPVDEQLDLETNMDGYTLRYPWKGEEVFCMSESDAWAYKDALERNEDRTGGTVPDSLELKLYEQIVSKIV